jgi:hypothetical protein
MEQIGIESKSLYQNTASTPDIYPPIIAEVAFCRSDEIRPTPLQVAQSQ